MPKTITVHGVVAAGFEPVRDAFLANFVRRGEIGAGFCVYRDGVPIIDLWGGVADRATDRPWDADTMAIVFSSTKGALALSLMLLADRGLLDYDAPVARYWPEFAQADKADITARTLLNHRAGLITIDQPFTLDDLAHDPQKVVDACARQAPMWAPGTDQGYHAVTFGLYGGELFRRVAGTSVGRFLADEIAGPLGADVFIGLPAHHDHRVAVNYPADTRERLTRGLPKLLFHRGLEGRVYRQAAQRGTATARAFSNPRELGPMGLDNYNTRRVRAMELPWSNGVASARGLARVYAALARGGELDGVRLLRPRSVEAVHRRQSWVSNDRVLRKPLGFAQGFIKEETRMFSPHVEAFGHPGAGGALGFCDPRSRLGIGYVMNRMGHHVRSPRALALCHALYRCL